MPLLLPVSAHSTTSESTARLMDTSGNIVQLPTMLQPAFARCCIETGSREYHLAAAGTWHTSRSRVCAGTPLRPCSASASATSPWYADIDPGCA